MAILISCRWSPTPAFKPSTTPPGEGRDYRQALDRSRGAFTSQLHLRANAHSLPIARHVLSGQKTDCLHRKALMAARDGDPTILRAAKGYDSDPITACGRCLRLGRTCTASAPCWKSPASAPCHVQYRLSRLLYTLRSRMACFINRLTSRCLYGCPRRPLRTERQQRLRLLPPSPSSNRGSVYPLPKLIIIKYTHAFLHYIVQLPYRLRRQLNYGDHQG